MKQISRQNLYEGLNKENVIMSFTQFINENQLNLQLDIISNWDILEIKNDKKIESDTELKSLNKYLFYFLAKILIPLEDFREIIKTKFDKKQLKEFDSELEDLTNLLDSTIRIENSSKKDFINEFNKIWLYFIDWCNTNKITIKQIQVTTNNSHKILTHERFNEFEKKHKGRVNEFLD